MARDREGAKLSRYVNTLLTSHVTKYLGLAANANYAASADKPAPVKACLTQAKRLSGGISTGDDSPLDLGRDRASTLQASGSAQREQSRGSCLFSRDANMSI
ncbi:hypothetical protein Bbelb_181820 [Branchiostoma belcheri]|nr:hypothetical protein Bbelb_181820 [Branchiostoma belcheri]